MLCKVDCIRIGSVSHLGFSGSKCHDEMQDIDEYCFDYLVLSLTPPLLSLVFTSAMNTFETMFFFLLCILLYIKKIFLFDWPRPRTQFGFPVWVRRAQLLGPPLAVSQGTYLAGSWNQRSCDSYSGTLIWERASQLDLHCPEFYMVVKTNVEMWFSFLI